MMHGEVLAVFEGLEAVDHDFRRWRTVLHDLLVEQEAVPAEAGDVPVDGLGADLEIARYLAGSHASGDLGDELGIEVGEFLPVGSGESLGAEGASTGFACEPLDTERGLESPEGSDLLVVPVGGVSVVETTIMYHPLSGWFDEGPSKGPPPVEEG